MGTRSSGLNGAARFRPWWVPWLWVGLPSIAVLWFFLYPFFNTVLLAFTDARPLGGGNWVGLENYRTLLTDSDFHQAVLNSVVYAICLVPPLTILPLLLALLVRDKLPGIGIFRSLFYVPAIASVVVVALAWTYLLQDDGLINVTLEKVNLLSEPLPFLSGRWMLLFSAMLISLWKGLPYFMILYLAALANVDRSLYEAAEVDGAGPIRRLWNITIPGVRVMMALVATLSMIQALKVFSEIHLLSNGTGGIGGRSSTMTMYIQQVGIADPTYGSLGLGSAASVVLFVMTLGFILGSQYFNRKADQ